eukprot:CAMPEP_0198131918 /NCGR_PEP_ID=MMETSP1442-20131203/57244_1 /TAXON_ID= /ORGANISM="Craspedostauros australis, Strain CCMP3328" /LENGTH=60 /DNA_ID=CAMNT_0043792819 /DNA_START=70 /DNA_END=252 /DNA_ORIENTATION=-
MTLLFETYTAYLGPLLKKHEAGSAIRWQDLQHSFKAAKSLYQGRNNDFVMVRNISASTTA